MDPVVDWDPNANRKCPKPGSLQKDKCKHCADDRNTNCEDARVIKVWPAVDVGEEVAEGDCNNDQKCLHCCELLRDRRSRVYKALPLVGFGRGVSSSRKRPMRRNLS